MTDRRILAPLGLTLCLVALAPADPMAKAPDVGTAYQVPYRLTMTNHYLVRVKINGKGPFNFLVDTGAPYVFVSTEVAKKINLPEAPKGDYWTAVDRFDLEGGAKLTKIKVRVEDPFQLVGMNAMGLPGVTIDGMLGYTVLARFKMEFDPTKDRMTWTRLDFDPEVPFVPRNLKIKEDPGIQAMNMLGPMMKGLSFLVGKQPEDTLHPQGLLGIEFDDGLKVVAVLPDSPAAKAGIKPGDRLAKLAGKAVGNPKAAHEAIATVKAGDSVKIEVERGGQTVAAKLTAAEGL